MIGVVVVLYRCPEVPKIVRDVARMPHTVVIAVDNSGCLLEDPADVTVIRSDRNLGYPAAVNLALSSLPEKLSAVLLINPDVEGPADALLELADSANAFHCPALCAPTCPESSCGMLPEPSFLGTILGYVLRRPTRRRLGEGFLSGAVLCLNAPARSILTRDGRLLREDLFYMDDVELSDRARRSGVAVEALPVTGLHHVGAVTSAGHPAPRIYFSRVSKIRYWRERSRWRGAVLAAFFFVESTAGIMGAFVQSVARGKSRPSFVTGFWLTLKWIVTRDAHVDAQALSPP